MTCSLLHESACKSYHFKLPRRCCVCEEAEEGDVLLLCDGCNSAFHLQCTKPRLRKVPAGEPSASSHTS